MRVSFSFEIARSFNPAKALKQMNKAIEEMEEEANREAFFKALDNEQTQTGDEPIVDGPYDEERAAYYEGLAEKAAEKPAKSKRSEAGRKAAETRRKNKEDKEILEASNARRAKRAAAKSADNAKAQASSVK